MPDATTGRWKRAVAPQTHPRVWGAGAPRGASVEKLNGCAHRRGSVRRSIRGERPSRHWWLDPRVLVRHRDHRCKASAEEIAASLTGHYQPEHCFALRRTGELA